MKAVIIFLLFLVGVTYSSVFREVAPQTRITDGYVASPKEFPYLALIVITFTNTHRIEYCTGSIISNEYILTSAYCIVYKTQPSYDVNLGSPVLGEKVSYRISYENMISHRDFDPRARTNDIALIKIPATTFKDSIKPIRLPRLEGKYSSCDNLGEKVLIAGWNYPSPRTVLYIEQNIVYNHLCSTHHISVSPTKICVSTSVFYYPSPGDLGGPLIKPSSGENDPIQLGILSFHPRGGYGNRKPAIYTRVAAYLTWIEKNSGIKY